jgi:site-specific recombinase XerD
MFASDALARFLLSLDGVKSVQTVTWYRRRLSSLVAFLGNAPVEAVSVDDLRRWRAGLAARTCRYEHHPFRHEPLKGGLSPFTLHGYVRAARRWFAWLFDEGMLPANPAARLELPKLPRAGRKGLSQLEMQRMIEAARASGIARDYAVVMFLACSLCRVGGLVGLRLGDLDLERGRALVREKGEKERTVYLERHAVNALRAWLVLRPDVPHDFVFVGRRGLPMTGNGVYQMLKRLAKAAGVKKFNPHAWRHGGARAMKLAGAPTGVVRQILGHEDERVTEQFYGDLDDEELAACHAQYTWLPDATPGE